MKIDGNFLMSIFMNAHQFCCVMLNCSVFLTSSEIEKNDLEDNKWDDLDSIVIRKKCIFRQSNVTQFVLGKIKERGIVIKSIY